MSDESDSKSNSDNGEPKRKNQKHKKSVAIRTATQNRANQNKLILSTESEEKNYQTAQNLINVKYKKTKEPEGSNEDIVDEFLMMQQTNKEIEAWSR